MKIIKLRAWDIKNQYMVTWDEHLDPDEDTYFIDIDNMSVHYNVDPNGYMSKETPAEIMLFTGLFDKDEKEIWEGDIVRVFDKIGEIIWNKDAARFSIMYFWSKHQHIFNIDCDDVIEFKVVGNIYENPELLEAA